MTSSNVINGQVHTRQVITNIKQFIQINTLERTVKDQSLAIDEHGAELESLYKKMSELEIRLESQEQYSRRTSLRFHNIKVPVNERGRIIHPVSTDDLILDICNTLPNGQS
jgi:uncharacterized coiled-coil protein SlyX